LVYKTEVIGAVGAVIADDAFDVFYFFLVGAIANSRRKDQARAKTSKVKMNLRFRKL
jgi:hypothetical protein